MKLEKLYTALWAGILAFLLSFGSVCCMVSAFHMQVSIGTVALWCGMASLYCSICYSLPLGALPMASVALISGILWQQGTLATSAEALVYRLSRQYDRAYDWGVLRLNHLTADEMELQLWLILCILGVVIAMAVSWAICRKQTALPGCMLSVLLLGSCLVVTDTVPKLIYLFLFLFASLMLMLTNTVRCQDEARGNRVCLMLAGPVAVLLLILLAVIPQKHYTGTEAPRKLMDRLINSESLSAVLGEVTENGVVGTSVDSSIVNLTTVGVRLSSNAEVMQVLTDYDDTLYLRGRALDQYDGKTWSDSGVSTRELYWPDPPRLSQGGEVMISTRYAHRMLYLPYYVQSRDMSEITRGLENSKKLTQYSFSCDQLSVENDYYKIYTQSAYDPDQWDLEFARYLHLESSVWGWAEPLALEITKGEESVYGRAQAIGEYVRNSARYDTNTHRMPSAATDFAKWFLEDSDTGYCVHFATAATVLLQAAGIPARYVTGYMVEAKSAYLSVVRADNAHAWAEYWLPGYGWMILEATPPDLRDETASADSTQATGETIATQPDATEPTTSRQDPVEDSGKKRSLGWLWWVLAGILLLTVLLAQWQLRLRYQRQQLSQGDANQRALQRWQLLTTCLRHTGCLPPAEMYALAEKAKFSQHTVTREELEQLDRAIAAARRLLQKRSVVHRFYYRIILALY